jgi:hypothetical protein
MRRVAVGTARLVSALVIRTIAMVPFLHTRLAFSAPEPVAGAFFMSGVLRPKDLR